MIAFFLIFFTVWAALHAYVGWRLASLPWVAAAVSPGTLAGLLAALALAYPAARALNSRGWRAVGEPLEWLAANWVGLVFLLLVALVFADLVTLGGWLWRAQVPAIRTWAALGALGLAVIALVQGARPPVVQEIEVRLAGLPRERDGFVLVAISDLHLGAVRGERWMDRQIATVAALRPDAVAVVGDLVDGNVEVLEPMLPVLRKLEAPRGVWAVTGNHEYYAGLEASVALLEAAGYRVLRDESAEVLPGLVFAGVDDLGARRQFGRKEPALQRALAGRPAGATVLLSHSPREVEQAAAAGVGLMLSGHTHAGQVWPFNYLVRLSTPWVGGRYRVGTLELIVGRGTGTWGPPMRLWQRSEILRLTLRSG